MEEANPKPCGRQRNSELYKRYQQRTSVPASRFGQVTPREDPLQDHEYDGCDNYQHARERYCMECHESSSWLERYHNGQLRTMLAPSGSSLRILITLCNSGASVSSDVLEFGASCFRSATLECALEFCAGLRETDSICGWHECAGISRDVPGDVWRTADEGAVFAIHSDSALLPSLP